MQPNDEYRHIKAIRMGAKEMNKIFSYILHNKSELKSKHTAAAYVWVSARATVCDRDMGI